MFQDLPWNSVLEAVDYVMQAHGRTAESIDDALKTKCNPATAFSDNWRESDTPEIRKALADVSATKDKEWFKRIDHGERLGQIILDSLADMDGKRLRTSIEGLISWIGE